MVSKLSLQNKVMVIPTVPFDFDSTFHKPDNFTTYNWDNLWKRVE